MKTIISDSSGHVICYTSDQVLIASLIDKGYQAHEAATCPNCGGIGIIKGENSRKEVRNNDYETRRGNYQTR